MTDTTIFVGLFWILPYFLIIVLNALYKKALVKQITLIETHTNQLEKFKLTRRYYKISLFIYSDNLDTKNPYRVYVNGQDVSQYLSGFFPGSSFLTIDLPVRKLHIDNVLEIKHKNNLPLSITVEGELNKVRQILLFILLAIITIATTVTIYYLSPLL